MTALLYLLVVLIWGTTWIAITLQQQADVAITVSIFYRFALAAGTMMIVLLLARRLRQLAVRDHLFALHRGFVFLPLIFTVSIMLRLISVVAWSQLFSQWRYCLMPSMA